MCTPKRSVWKELKEPKESAIRIIGYSTASNRVEDDVDALSTLMIRARHLRGGGHESTRDLVYEHCHGRQEHPKNHAPTLHTETKLRLSIAVFSSTNNCISNAYPTMTTSAPLAIPSEMPFSTALSVPSASISLRV